jgi:autotransporter translocation and assembly factor TamB
MRRRMRRAGWVFLGAILGLALVGIVLLLYFRLGQVAEVRTAIGERLQIPEEALYVERVTARGRARISLRNVVIYGEGGDTLVASPRVTMWFDATSLAGDGPIDFHQVELRSPFARLIQAPDGSWNIQQAMVVTADGHEVAGEVDGRPLRFRDVRLIGGRVLLAVPTERPEPGTFAARLALPYTRIGGLDYQSYSLSAVDARLPLVRVGGALPWRVEVGSLTAQLQEPQLRIAQLQGWAEAQGEDGVRFALGALQVGSSRLAGSGTIRFAEPATLYDVQLQGAPLQLADLRPLLPDAGLEGRATFDMTLATAPGGRAALAFSSLDLSALGSNVSGTVRVGVGGGEPLAFGPTNLTVDPLDLGTLEQLGLVQELPVLGTIRGSLTTAEFTPETQAGRLQVNLAASLVPRDQPNVTPSTIVAVGPLAFGGADRPVVFDGLRIQMQPLYLATLGAMLPEQRELLRGEARGFVQLSGTTADLRLAGGEIVYRVGAAEPTRLTNLSGRIALDPLAYDVQARAEPLALATLNELFPALPFETATLSGPIRVQGGQEALTFDVNLTGAAGGIQMAGSARFADPLAFDVSGQLAAFTASRLLRAEVPLEGPVTGRFSARGTADDIRFEVDLVQALGTFALGGRVQRTVEPPLFEVAGRVSNFRLGALLGQPGLFPSPMTGDIAVSGGGGRPYGYDVDLRGPASVLDLEGTFQPGPVPIYTARGQVLGLDLQRLPYDLPLPPTVLNASIALDARGTTLETFAGSLWLNASGSSVGGILVDQARAELTVVDGVLQVDTLAVLMRGNRVLASGTWGLVRPVADPLRFSINAPDLATLSRVVPTIGLVPPQLAGALTAEGWVAGSVQYPRIAANVRGRRLRYESYRAGTLAMEIEASRQPGVGWSGRTSLAGDNVVFVNEQFQVVRLEASGTEAALAVGLYARQDANRDIAASGILELEGLTPRSISIETLNLRLADASWQLVQSTRLQWDGARGLEVQNLALQRTGEVGGWLQVDGRLPPTGAADLRVNVRDLDLADARRIWARAPEIEGRVTLDAVLEGPATAPEMTISARIDQLRYAGTTADAILINADYLDRRLEGRADVIMAGRQIATVEASVPMLLSYEDFTPRFEPLMNEPLRAQVFADSLPLDLVTAVTPGISAGAGVANAQISVGGTLATPSVAGFARIAGGAMALDALGVRLTDIRTHLVLEQNRIRIDTLTARSQGTISVAGLVTFEPGAPPRLNLSADLLGFRAIDNREVGRVTTSGRVALAGPVTEPVLTGQLRLEDSQLNVPEMDEATPIELADLDLDQVGGDPLAELELQPVFFTDLRIDGLEVSAGDGVWLVSDDMRVQIVGDIVIYRVGTEQRVFGGLQTVRGRYTLAIGTITREFDVVSGNVQFMGTPDINPAVDIVAANRVRTATAGPGGDLVVLVHLTGTLQNPQLRITSDTPVPLSESELLSYLIFGRPEFELGGAPGDLAQQILVQEVLGGLVAAELERPFLAAGICDYVRVRPGIATFGGLFRLDPLSTLNAAAIECGRELPWLDGLFLTVETGIGGLFGGGTAIDWGIGLEWQINEEWQWELQYGPVRRDYLRLVDPTTRYQLSTDIRRRWEYGGVRRRSILEAVPERPILPGEVAPSQPLLAPQPAPPRMPVQEPQEQAGPPAQPALREKEGVEE